MLKLLATVALTSILLSACASGQTANDDALTYASEACGIRWVDESGNEVEPGNGSPEFDDSTSGEDDPATEPLKDMQTTANDWKQRATDATAAAQIDTAWIPLSNAVQDVIVIKQKAREIREKGRSGRDFWNAGFTNDDVAKHNAGLDSYKAQCNALASRL